MALLAVNNHQLLTEFCPNIHVRSSSFFVYRRARILQVDVREERTFGNYAGIFSDEADFSKGMQDFYDQDTPHQKGLGLSLGTLAANGL